jgi:hypothetical protein
MANRTVNINILNGGLGQLGVSEDNVFGLVLQSAVAPSGLALLTPTQITSLQDAEDLGITAAFDTANTVTCYRVLAEFYAEAGSGTPLWIMFTAQTVTLTVVFDVANEATYFGKLQAASGGKCRIMSMVRSFAGGYSATTTAGVDADVLTAMTKAQALVEEFRGRHMPFAVIMPGHYYQDDVSALQDISTATNRWVAGLIGSTATGAGCAIGILLGRLASIAVDKQPGRVKDGALTVTAAYLNTTAISLSTKGKTAGIETKGWITFDVYQGKSGFFFTNDWTATARTDDFDRLARVRIIQKVERIVYSVYLNEILDDIALDPSTGKMSTNAAKFYQQIIQRAIDDSLTAEGEISGLQVQVDPEQNVLSTGEVCVDVRLVPDAYANQFKINLGYNNPANQ